jgi:hypothetical protein
MIQEGGARKRSGTEQEHSIGLRIHAVSSQKDSLYDL